MKTKFFSVLAFAFIFIQLDASSMSASPLAKDTAPTNFEIGGDPGDIKVVVSQKRIWLVADETPVKCLKTQIKNASGKVVLEKCLSLKTADWFLNIEALPKGEYTLCLGDERNEKFRK